MTLSITNYSIDSGRIIIERADWFDDNGNYLKRADLDRAADLHKYTLKFAPDAIRNEAIRLISDRLGLVFDPFQTDGEFVHKGDPVRILNDVSK